MRVTALPLLFVAWIIVAVLGFDLIAASVARFAHVPYAAFMVPDFALFIVLGYVVTRRAGRLGPAAFYVLIAAFIEASAGRALATALDAEPPPPPTTPEFLVIETVAVASVTGFWGCVGLAIAALLPRGSA